MGKGLTTVSVVRPEESESVSQFLFRLDFTRAEEGIQEETKEVRENQGGTE